MKSYSEFVNGNIMNQTNYAPKNRLHDLIIDKEESILESSEAPELVKTEPFLSEYQPFLAALLAEKSPSAIIGLTNRFPEVLNKREQLPYWNCRLFQLMTMKQGELTRQAYALLEAQNVLAIQQECTALLRKQYGKIENRVKRYQSSILPVLEYQQLLNSVAPTKNLKVVESICTLSLLESWMREYDVCYESHPAIEKMKEFMTEVHAELLTPFDTRGFNLDSSPVNASQLKTIKQQIRPLYQGYQKHLNQDVLRYIKEVLALSSNQMMEYLKCSPAQLSIFMTFGHNYTAFATSGMIQQLDVEQLLYLLREQYAKIHQLNTEEVKAEEPFYEFLDKYLIPATLSYVLSKQYMLEKQEYWKQTKGGNAIQLQQIQQRLVQAQDEIKKLKCANCQLSEQHRQFVEQEQEHILQKTKPLTQALLEANQQNQRLTLRIEELEQQLKAAYIPPQSSFLETDMALFGQDCAPRLSFEWSVESLIEYFNVPDTLIVGGHPRLINKLKQLLPNAKYWELDQSVGKQFFNGVKRVCLMVQQLNHGMSYRLDKCVPSAPRLELTRTNPMLLLQEMGIEEGLIPEFF